MKMVKSLTLLTAIVALVAVSCSRESAATREWAFKMEKVWEIQKIGEDELLRPAEPRVADDGTLYFHDFARNLSHIINADGRPVATFAPQGGSEGEVSFYLNCFPAGDQVVICAPDKLHFFTKQGQFVKAIPNNIFTRFPLAFKNENEFWVAPGALGDAPHGLATVTHVDLTSGQETVVHKFSLSDDEKKPSGGAVIIGLTPQIKMGFDRQANRIYFGKNSDTTIYRLTPDGDKLTSFSFTGMRQSVTEADKRNHFAKFNVPEERVAMLIGALPDRMTYYDRIQIASGLIYLLGAERIGHSQTGLVADVYNPDGRHLYHGRIQVEEGWHIFSNPDNLQLADGFVYAVQENDVGTKKIVKYKISLPKS